MHTTQDSCGFGDGIVSQGEIITSREQHRLIAKRAWLQLWDYLVMNDEIIKSTRLPVPWSMEEDRQLQMMLSISHRMLSRFKSPESYREYLATSESHYREDLVRRAFKEGIHSHRQKWVFSRVLAENPTTVLDVGSGYGQMALLLGREGCHVTGLLPNAAGVKYANQIATEEKVPVEFLNFIFEECDFEGRTFDVVLFGEVLEHVADEVSALQKACDLAKKCVVLTVPNESCDHGFGPNSEWAKFKGEHVRVFTKKSLENLLSMIPDISYEGIDEEVSCHGLTGNIVTCLCVKLVKRKENCDVGKVLTSANERSLDGDDA